jgi:hypothetical protein
MSFSVSVPFERFKAQRGIERGDRGARLAQDIEVAFILSLQSW